MPGQIIGLLDDPVTSETALERAETLFDSLDLCRRQLSELRVRVEAHFIQLGSEPWADAFEDEQVIRCAFGTIQFTADRGIDQKVPAGTWNEVVQILSAGLKSGNACDAYCKAIERCGEILAEHFPRQPDDQDELTNKLIIER